MNKPTDTLPSGAASSKEAGKRKRAPAKPKEPQAVHQPDMETLVKTNTVAEAMDIMSHQGKTETIPLSVLTQFEEKAEPIRATMKDAARQEKRSRSAHARSLGLAHPLVRSLCEQPALLCAMIERNGDKVTERTAKSPCLPAIKALYPDLDRREQSSLAQIHNHALACGWTGDELQREVESGGSVEIIKRERQRQRQRAGGTPAPSAAEIVAAYREQTAASPRSDVCPPKTAPALGAMLGIIEFVDGKVVIYDIDTDEKRLVAAINSCTKRGSELVVRSSTVVEAAE